MGSSNKRTPKCWPGMEVGPATIAELVKKFGVGRASLGRMVGATSAMIWKWETGLADPSRPAQMLIYYISTGKLNVDPKEFVRKRGRKRKS